MAAKERRCGRPKTNGQPCRAILHGEMYRACCLHQTAEDLAFAEGYRLASATARAAVERERQGWITEGRRAELRDQADAARQAEELARFRTHTEDGEQIVTCGRYTYTWAGPGSLAVGDRVTLPANYVNRSPFEGTVTALGSSYRGALSRVVRRLPAAAMA
jgi:hypothetical protein